MRQYLQKRPLLLARSPRISAHLTFATIGAAVLGVGLANVFSSGALSNTFQPLYRKSLRVSPSHLAFSFVRMSSTKPSVTKLAPGWDPHETPFPTAHRSNDSFTFESATKGQVIVPEPYLWLETPPSQSSQTKEWVDAQAAFTEKYASKCQDRRVLKERLLANLNYARYSSPGRTGRGTGQDSYYYSHNSGLDPQATYYRATREDLSLAESRGYPEPPGTKWFDQNLLSEDGTIALSGLSFSKSGKMVAYGISKSGSDWVTYYFRDVNKPFTTPAANAEEAATGGPDRLPDVIQYLKYTSVSWTGDDQGIFYQRYPPPSKDRKNDGTETDASKNAALYYHKLGTSQEEDICVIPRDEKVATSLWQAEVTRDGKWLLVTHTVDTDTKARTYVAPLDQPIGSNMKWICLVPSFKYQLNFIHNEDNVFYFVTNKDAPNYKIVRTVINADSATTVTHVTDLQEEALLEEVVAEDPSAPINDAVVVQNDKLLLVYSRDVKDELIQAELRTGKKVQRLLSDFVGSISSISGRAIDDEAFVGTVSFVNPGTVYRLNWKGVKDDVRGVPSTSKHRVTQVKGIDPSQYISRQIFVTSKDGTKIPVFLTHRKDTPMDGTAPVWLYFYGGFGISLNPTFSASLMTWIGSYGGVLAWVNARGGGEYGDSWHDAGRLLKKQNVFDDVISTAEYLVDSKIAAKGKIIVNGGSNGGLGAMAVGNQAPEGLLGGVVAEVGVHDMLRFSLFTAGKFWTADYGNPQEDSEMFDYVHKYSPLHNGECKYITLLCYLTTLLVNANKTYPVVLLMSGDHDDRVSPLHTFKMAAELQYRLPQ